MKLRFAKMHGLGNDFMVIDAISQRFRPRAELVRRWADRFHGVGFDQMLIVEPPQTDAAQFRYRIYNADGGEVEQCGNGARCFGRFVREQGMTGLDVIPVETCAGMLYIERIDGSRYRVNMGVPRFEPAEIPLRATARQGLYHAEYAGADIEFGACSIGNPHMVIRVDDVDTARVNSLGRYFESHALFPERVNVGFLQLVDRERFRLRVYERGVGETRACGSGACAAMAVANRQGWLGPEATGSLSGGELKLEWQGEENPVMMTGDTEMVYLGEIEYE